VGRTVTRSIALEINGERCEAQIETDTTLLELLRNDLGLRGTVEGCGVGVCGSCTVLVDARVVSSCLMLAFKAAGRTVTTIEGVAPPGALSDVQRAFLEAQAFQCGFCTSGMIMAVHGLLHERPSPSNSEILDFLAGNLCRCGTYREVMMAVQLAVRMRQGQRVTNGVDLVGESRNRDANVDTTPEG
jgi:aerobic-type carbon monoxide dehydrogenase small subunit (CoxS/CutS family)